MEQGQLTSLVISFVSFAFTAVGVLIASPLFHSCWSFVPSLYLFCQRIKWLKIVQQNTGVAQCYIFNTYSYFRHCDILTRKIQNDNRCVPTSRLTGFHPDDVKTACFKTHCKWCCRNKTQQNTCNLSHFKLKATEEKTFVRNVVNEKSSVWNQYGFIH